MSRCGPLWRRPSVKAIQQRDIEMIHSEFVTATPNKKIFQIKIHLVKITGTVRHPIARRESQMLDNDNTSSPAPLDDSWEIRLRIEGSQALLDHLEETLREQGDHTSLFYTKLMRARHRLGLPETPTGPSSEIPPAFHDAIEQAIRDAATELGEWALGRGDLAGAWTYYRLLNQPQPIQEALAKIDLNQFGNEKYDMVETAIRLAFHEGLDPVRGFGWILGRYGLCNAITTMSSPETPGGPDARKACLELLVNALHGELVHRLSSEVERLEGVRPVGEDAKPPFEPGTIAKLLAGRDSLFDDEAYHIDLSHLSSVVQLGQELAPGAAMARVRDLCAYGKKLKGRFVPNGEPPFDPLFDGQDRFFAALMGDETEKQVAYFKEIADRELAEGNPFPAEILRKLLERLGRTTEALEWAGRTLSPQGLAGICRAAGNFRPMMEAAKAQGDPVHLVAALLEQARVTAAK